MEAQLQRWCSLHPTFPKRGHFFEIPASWMLPRLAGIGALAGVIWYWAPQLLLTQKPASLEPEFVAEARKIGSVAQRVNGPPVFLNPFYHRIPGNIQGPEDVKKELQ